jgi:hypothetical protein
MVIESPTAARCPAPFDAWRVCNVYMKTVHCKVWLSVVPEKDAGLSALKSISLGLHNASIGVLRPIVHDNSQLSSERRISEVKQKLKPFKCEGKTSRLP